MSDVAKQKQRFTFFGQVFGGRAFLVVLVATIIAGFAEPDFGWNPMSARLLLTMWLVYLILNYGGALVRVINGVRKKQGVLPRISARPVYLVFLVFSILFARLTEIEPALIFGAVLALEYTAETSLVLRKYTGRATLAGALHNMLVGLVSWVFYSVVVSALPFIQTAINTSDSAALKWTLYLCVTFADLFAILAVAALAALPISLLPISFLEGNHIWRWNKTAWGIAYTLGCLVYSVVLVSLPKSWSTTSVSFDFWMGVYIAYFVVAMAIWAYLRFTGEKKPQLAE